jgi:tetratricopeptide (TPR) repeat protein
LIARDNHNFESAAKLFGRAAKVYADLNMSADFARLQSNIGDLLWQQGDPNGARGRLEDAAKRRRDLGLRDGLAITLGLLGDVRLAQDERDAALAAYKEAQAIELELHQDDYASVTEISIARALLENGDPAQAEKLARKLVAWCSTKHDSDNEVFARDVLIRALLGQHRDPEAVKEAHELEHAISPKLEPDTRFSARITVAQALATQKSSPRALADLRNISTEAHQKGFVQQELTANLALAESEKQQGTAPNANAINNLTSRARTKGYLLIARKCASLLSDK